MTEEYKTIMDGNSSECEPDSVVDMLIDARPTVTPLSSEAAGSIFNNAFHTYSAGPSPARRGLVGARLTLSAAFCVCSAAGLLLLHSTASVRSRRVASQVPSTLAAAPTQAASLRRGSPQYRVNSLSLVALSVKQSRTFTGRKSVASAVAVPGYQIPLAPVCGLTTFNIFTTASAMRPMSVDPGGAVDPDGESLLVCIVSNANQSACSKESQDSHIDVEKPSDSDIDGCILIDSVGGDSFVFVKETENSPAKGQVLVGAAINECIEVKPGSTGICFAFQNTGAGLTTVQSCHTSI